MTCGFVDAETLKRCRRRPHPEGRGFCPDHGLVRARENLEDAIAWFVRAGTLVG